MSGRDLFRKAKEQTDGGTSGRDLFQSAPRVDEPPKPPPSETEQMLAMAESALKQYGPGLAKSYLHTIAAPAVLPREVYDYVSDPEKYKARTRSAASGMTLGLAPKLEAANAHLMGNKETDADYRGLYNKAVSENPVENLAGSALVPIPGAGIKGAGGVALRVGGSSLLTGASEAAQAPEGGRGEAFKSGLEHGALGGVGGEVAGRLAPALHDTAGKLYIRAIGPKAGITNLLAIEGIRGREIPDLGHALYDEGLVPWATKEEALSKAEGRLGELGPEYESAKDEFDRWAPNGFSYTEAADATALPRNALPIDRSASQHVNQLENTIRQTTGGLGNALETRSKAWRASNFDNNPPLSEDLYNEAVGRYRDNIIKQVGDVNGPQAAEDFRDLDRRWGLAKTAQTLSEPAVQRSAFHSSLSPLEAGVGHLAGGPMGVAKMALAKPLLGAANGALGRGAHAASIASEAGARMIPGASRATASPQQSFAQWLAEQEDAARENHQ
jgi:hypothetical protein